MKILLQSIRLGEQYVYLDGWVIPTTAGEINIEGWHSQHNLNSVPQVAALNDPEIGSGLLSSPAYWESTALKQEDG
jgi:hypothetical protein